MTNKRHCSWKICARFNNNFKFNINNIKFETVIELKVSISQGNRADGHNRADY